MSDHHDHEELSMEVQAELERLAECLGQLHDSASGLLLDELDADIEVGYEGDTVLVGITLGYPCASQVESWHKRVKEACEPLLKSGPLGGSSLQFELFSDIPATSSPSAPEPLQGVKNIVAVASGKGGGEVHHSSKPGAGAGGRGSPGRVTRRRYLWPQPTYDARY
ncbi:hypothetical protein P3339_19640 [Microbulbifer sp. MLAF003]|nr:hypothetical protein [Microbulbifer sp. MLAF003]WHI50620.1 hypothetical protein P3339_19640 [Microbulbifer sp. MLAF003]